MANRNDRNTFDEEDELNPFSNAGSVPSAAISRLSPLPHEPVDFYDGSAPVDIPLDSAGDLKKKERELQARETELKRREQNAGSVPSAANSRLSPLPHEPVDFYDRSAPVDISLDSAGDLKKKERELQSRETKVKRREQDLKKKEQELEARETKLKRREQDLKKKERELRARERELRARETELKRREQSDENVDDSSRFGPLGPGPQDDLNEVAHLLLNDDLTVDDEDFNINIEEWDYDEETNHQRNGGECSLEPVESEDCKSISTRPSISKQKKAADSSLSFKDYEVIGRTPVVGLPEGWIKERRQRQLQDGRLRKDPYFIHPSCEYEFRSQPDVESYLKSKTKDVNECCKTRPKKRALNKTAIVPLVPGQSLKRLHGAEDEIKSDPHFSDRAIRSAARRNPKQLEAEPKTLLPGKEIADKPNVENNEGGIPGEENLVTHGCSQQP